MVLTDPRPKKTKCSNSQKQDGCNTYGIMKKICHPDYHLVTSINKV